MNNELDKLLQDVLSTSGTYDTEKGELIKKEVASMYDKKLKLWRYIIWAVLAIDTILILAGINIFFSSTEVQMQIGSAAMVLLVFESSILTKLWYWQMNTKFSILKEITELRLQIAQMGDRKNGIEE